MALELSILIATMPKRQKCFYELLDKINSQLAYIENVEIITDASMSYNIGTKRNSLLSRSKGKYIVFIDDDDSIATNYIFLILEACKSNADCIGISGTILHEGITKQWHISKDYGHWFTKDNVFYRTPNHISPVKREIALKAMFPEIPHGEDAEYSRRILPFLQTETKITGNIYFYYPSH